MTSTTGTITGPDQIHQAFQQATNSNDVDALVAMYDPDGIAVQLDGGQCTGVVELRAMFTNLTEMIRHIDGRTRKIFVAGDLALTSATWTAEIVLPDGTTTQQTGITAEVSRRQSDGTWKLVIDDPMFG